ncbi:MAG: hypothetical protein HN383_18580 [Verrucomicrobia bacterium]|nr:hypothetical protein [Verrucomicrobiota bacterium]MBT7702578.1 hypothetical protein [Verrucomicrobiota bacterium]
MFLVLVTVTVGAVAEPEAQARVLDIDGTNYLSIVHRELGAATGSVVVTMFQMRIPETGAHGNPVLVLVNDLIAAHRRGADVKVILDLNRQYDPASEEPVRDRVNGVAADMLSFAGVDVSYYASPHYLHQKLVVIDETTVIVGSHNWTYSGMRRNLETSSLIRSREHAQAKLANTARIKTVPATSPRTTAVDRAVPIPISFLVQPDLAPAMLTANDGRAFDTYLLLRRYAAEAKQCSVSVDMQRLVTDLAISRDKGWDSARRQAMRTLHNLARNYGLIDLELARRVPPKVALLDDPPEPETGFFHVPMEFWTYGLATNLKQVVKFGYLICLNEETQGLTPPLWRRTLVDLADRYSTTIDSVGTGMNTLQKLDVLTILRYPPPHITDYARRPPNKYRLKPLLSPEARAARWRRLEEKHTPSRIEQARTLAASLSYDHSFTAADQLAGAITTYGYQAVSNTTAQVATKHPGNPRRHPSIVLERLDLAR